MGASLLMPGSTIKPLLAASQTTPYFPFDDTYLIGLCTDKAGIKVRLSDRYSHISNSEISLAFLKIFVIIKTAGRNDNVDARSMSSAQYNYVDNRFCWYLKQVSLGNGGLLHERDAVHHSRRQRHQPGC